MNEIIGNITQITGFSYGRLLSNLPGRAYRFLQIYYPTLILLGIIGLLFERKKEVFNKKGELFILSFLFFHLITIAGITSATRRYAVSLVPLTIFWAGKGFYELWQRLKKYEWRSKRLLYPLVILLIIGSQLPVALKPIRFHRAEQKTVGLWLREHSARDSCVASVYPQEAFYADRKWIQVPWEKKTYEGLLKFLKQNRASYLVVDHSMKEVVPDFFSSIDKKDLEEIYKIDKRGKEKVVIFKVR